MALSVLHVMGAQRAGEPFRRIALINIFHFRIFTFSFHSGTHRIHEPRDAFL